MSLSATGGEQDCVEQPKCPSVLKILSFLASSAYWSGCLPGSMCGTASLKRDGGCSAGLRFLSTSLAPECGTAGFREDEQWVPLSTDPCSLSQALSSWFLCSGPGPQRGSTTSERSSSQGWLLPMCMSIFLVYASQPPMW